MQRFRLLFLIVLAAMLSGCGYNTIQQQDEAVKAQWSEVLNQYQRRADLVPNLVATVKGYAKQEQDTLVKVTEARAKATSIQVSAADLTDPDKVAQYQAAQGQLKAHVFQISAGMGQSRFQQALQIRLRVSQGLLTQAPIHGNFALAPAGQQGGYQVGVVAEVPVKAATGHTQRVRQHQYPHALKAVLYRSRKSGV